MEPELESGTRMGNKVWAQSGHKNLQVGQEWEQSMGTKWAQEPASGTSMGTKWEHSGNKNLKVGQEVEPRGKRVGTRTCQ